MSASASASASASSPPPLTSADIEDAVAPVVLKKGSVYEAKISLLSYGGKPIAHLEHGDPSSSRPLTVINPAGVLPGQRVQLRVTKLTKKKNIVEAMVLSELSKADGQIEPKCVHFGKGCGGCKTQNWSYENQLGEKARQLNILYDILNNPDGVRRIIGCEDVFNYRNKMEFTVGKSLWRTEKPNGEPVPNDDLPLKIGLHASGRFDKIVAIEQCHLHPDVGNGILKFVEKKATELMWEAHDQRKHTGFFRNLMIRSATDLQGKLQIMVNLVTSPTEVLQPLESLAKEIADEFPDVVSVVLNTTNTMSGVAIGDKEDLLYGVPYIEQKLRGLSFRISANSFFQPNPAQADVLYGEIEKAADLTGEETVVDLFCGTGSIGLSLAKKCKRMVGIELVDSAVHDARINAKINGIENAEFILADLNNLRKGAGAAEAVSVLDLAKPDVMVIDPPRSGMHPDLIKKHIAKSPPKRIVYVSCNPSSQVRDILMLQELVNYRVVSVQPVDMFPHTPHIECVTRLDLVNDI